MLLVAMPVPVAVPSNLEPPPLAITVDASAEAASGLDEAGLALMNVLWS